MPAWLIWIILAAALGAAEFFTLTFVLGLLAAAALVAALLGAIGLPVVVQVIGFAAAAAAGIVLVKPIMDRQLTRGRTPVPARPPWWAAPAWSSRRSAATTAGSNCRERSGQHAVSTRTS